jgi:asparagine synthase (glutamine-hydrolysing)
MKQDRKSISMKLKIEFLNAVKLRLRSDVAIGSCLSGGMDSSAIVCVINSLMKEQRSNR